MLSLNFCIVCLIIKIYLFNAELAITILYEEKDLYTRSLIDHFNVSYSYFKNFYSYTNEITLDIGELGNGTTRADIIRKTEKTDFVISLVTNSSLQQIIQELSYQVDLAVVQLHLTDWNGIYPATLDSEIIFEEYVCIVPASIVLGNMLTEFFDRINVSSRVTVIYDDIVPQNDLNWRKQFLQLSFPINFVQMANPTDPAAVRSQLSSLTQSTSTIVFLAKTHNVEYYILYGEEFIVRNMFTWVQLALDTLPFKCDDCIATEMYVVRALPTGKAEDLRLLNDYIISQELNIDMNYTIKSYEETFISTAFDSVKLAFLYLIADNATLVSLLTPDQKLQFEGIGTNKTMFDIISLKNIKYEYGQYIHHFKSYFYQDTTAGIFRINRRQELPDHSINKFIGNWTFMNGVTPFYGFLTVDVRQINHYRVVTVIQQPFIEFAHGGSSDQFQGYCIDLLNLIQQELQFTYELYQAPDGKFGSVDDNGNWNGLIGEVVVGKADIALAPLSVMAERENDIDFTVPYYDLVGTTILMKKSDVEYSLFKFMKVLEWPVWLCIVAAYLFTSILLWLFEKFSPYSYSNNKEKFKLDPEKREFTLKECLWFCLTSLTPQGGGEAPKNVSGRLVAATWWLFGFIIIASYTANLAAFLTVSRLEQSINSLDDLAKQYKIEYSPIKGGATETYFRRMAQIEELLYNTWKAMSLNESMTPLERAKLAVWDYPVSDKFTNMWRYMQESKLPDGIPQAIDRVLNSDTGFAFIGDAMEIKYAILTNCKLQQVGTEFSRKPYAIAVQSGSGLKDEISATILKLLNERQLEALKEKWWNENPHKVKCPDVDDESNGISIQNIGGVFIVILAGIVLSFITLIFEYMYYKRKGQKNLLKRSNARHSTEMTNASASSEMQDPTTTATTATRNRFTLHNGNIPQYTNSAFQF